MAIDKDRSSDVIWNELKIQNNLNDIEVSNNNFSQLIEVFLKLKQLKHENIDNILDSWACLSKVKIVFLTESWPGSTIRSYLGKIGPQKKKVIKSWIIKILKGLDYLHKNKYVYKYLNCGRLYYHPNTGNVCIGDIFLGTDYYNNHNEDTCSNTPFEWYVPAPEVIENNNNSNKNNSKISNKSDIFSLGMSILEMITLEFPYISNLKKKRIDKDSYKLVKKMILNKEYPNILNRIPDSEEIKHFIKKLINFDIDQRPTAVELLEDPFLEIKSSDNKVLELLKKKKKVNNTHENSNNYDNNADFFHSDVETKNLLKYFVLELACNKNTYSKKVFTEPYYIDNSQIKEKNNYDMSKPYKLPFIERNKLDKNNEIRNFGLNSSRIINSYIKTNDIVYDFKDQTNNRDVSYFSNNNNLTDEKNNKSNYMHSKTSNNNIETDINNLTKIKSNENSCIFVLKESCKDIKNNINNNNNNNNNNSNNKKLSVNLNNISFSKNDDVLYLNNSSFNNYDNVLDNVNTNNFMGNNRIISCNNESSYNINNNNDSSLKNNLKLSKLNSTSTLNLKKSEDNNCNLKCLKTQNIFNTPSFLINSNKRDTNIINNYNNSTRNPIVRNITEFNQSVNKIASNSKIFLESCPKISNTYLHNKNINKDNNVSYNNISINTKDKYIIKSKTKKNNLKKLINKSNIDNKTNSKINFILENNSNNNNLNMTGSFRKDSLNSIINFKEYKYIDLIVVNCDNFEYIDCKKLNNEYSAIMDMSNYFDIKNNIINFKFFINKYPNTTDNSYIEEISFDFNVREDNTEKVINEFKEEFIDKNTSLNDLMYYEYVINEIKLKIEGVTNIINI